MPFGSSESPAVQKMTDRTLPLLFVNLGGEMLYIIEDRLTNQEIPPDKTKKGETRYQQSGTPLNRFSGKFNFKKKIRTEQFHVGLRGVWMDFGKVGNFI
jgi:hypothetical protein